MEQLLILSDIVEATVVKRPSCLIKSPYVADVEIKGDVDLYLGHTPALGCCGLSDKNATVIMTPSYSSKNKCKYTVQLSMQPNTIVGINPKLAEKIVEQCLQKNLLQKLRGATKVQREKTIGCSRFDFAGIDGDGIPFLMEVKNVPLADYEDLPAKIRKTMSFDDRNPLEKVAYFPDGYRKTSSEPVSPRALKHIRELHRIKKGNPEKIRCLMCYVIQRTDVNRFTTSVVDQEYKMATKEAFEDGVEIITLQIKWSINDIGEAVASFIRDDL